VLTPLSSTRVQEYNDKRADFRTKVQEYEKWIKDVGVNVGFNDPEEFEIPPSVSDPAETGQG